MTAYECITRAQSNRVNISSIESAYSLIMTYKHKIWPDYADQASEMKELEASLQHYGFYDDEHKLKDYTIEQAIDIINTIDNK